MAGFALSDNGTLAKAVEKLPADRFDTAQGFRNALVNVHFMASSSTTVADSLNMNPHPEDEYQNRTGYFRMMAPVRTEGLVCWKPLESTILTRCRNEAV